jgi:hypothetical protein
MDKKGKIDNLITQLTSDPTAKALIEIGVLIDNLKKNKREFENKVGKMASMVDLEKAEELERINSEISRLIKLQKGLKNGNIKPEDAVLIQPVIETKKTDQPKNDAVDVEPTAIVTPVKEVAQEPVVIAEPIVVVAENKEPPAKVTDEPVQEAVVAHEEPVAEIKVTEKIDVQKPAEPTVKNIDKTSELDRLKKEQRNREIEAIKFGREIGQSKEALEAMDISRKLIDEVYDAEEKPVVDQEKMNALIEMVVTRNKNKKEKQKKLAELLALREQLLAQEAEKESSDNEDEGDDKDKKTEESDGESAQEDKKNEDLIDIEKTRSEYIAKQKEIEKLQEEVDDLDEINYSDGLLQSIKSAFNPSWWKRDIKIGKLNKKIKALEIEQAFFKGRLDAKEIKLDEKHRPFIYFVAKKSQNPGLKFKKVADTTDLRWATWMTPEGNDFEAQRKTLTVTGVDEGFFEFNIFGFTKVLKNVNEMRVEEDGKKFIASYSPEAIYKIVGPDGTIVADDIEGYVEATRAYNEATEKYKKQVEEEWDKLNKK